MLNQIKPQTLIEAYVPLLLWAGFIFFLSAQSTLPGLDSSLQDYLFKKLSHMTVYAVLYLLTVRTVYFHTGEKFSYYWYIPLVVCFIYAITDEVHQSLTPSRTPSINDLGFDMLGVYLAFLKQYRYI